MPGETERSGWWGDRRWVAATLGAGAVVLVGGSGLAVASAASHPEPASAGRLLSFEYATVRAPRYAPPPPTEEGRLDVRPPAALYRRAEAAAPEADAAWRAMQAEEARRMSVALAEVRASDRRLDRELAAQLKASRWEAQPRPEEPGPAGDRDEGEGGYEG